jgi:exonuclease SbcD
VLQGQRRDYGEFVGYVGVCDPDSMRILHFADVHLDRPFMGLPFDVAARRRHELFEAFRRCLATARERRAELITIGGDLWEEEHVTADTRNSVCYELAQAGLPVLIACGNHDPLIEGGSYLRTEWPDNVTVVRRGSVGEHSFGDVCIWSVSWGGGDLSPRLLERLEAPVDGRTHVLLVHGTSIAAPFADPAGESYCPFDPKFVRRAGLAICLGGHIHAASFVDDVVYPGSPEPLGWGEHGRHCVALVEIQAGEAKVELIDINEKRYEKREVDCSGCASSAEVDARIVGALTEPDPQNVFLRLRLVGEVGADCTINRTKIVGQHRAGYAALVVEDATEPLLDIDNRAERKSLDGLFVRKLRQKIATASTESERRLAELALQAGLHAIDGHEVILRVD